MTPQERVKKISQLKDELAELLREDSGVAGLDMKALLKECADLKRSNHKWDAVRLYRARTGSGLRESAYAVDNLL